MELLIIFLIITHVMAFLIGKSIKESKVLSKHYPDYKRLKERESFTTFLDEVHQEDTTTYINKGGREIKTEKK